MFQIVRGLIGTVFALNLASAAMAADLPVKAPRAPAALPAYWTGLYIGIHGGGAWGTIEANAVGFPISSHEINGPIAGGQIGYNYQFGWGVIGLEGTFSWADIKGTTPCFVVASCSTRTNFVATAAARLGALVGNHALVFVKGGAAWADDKYKADFSAVLGGPVDSASETRFGWLGGFGVEYKFNQRWSGVLEYNYLDFGTDSVTFAAGDVDIKHVNHVVKAGLNYKLY